MAKHTTGNVIIENAFSIYDERVKILLDMVPKAFQDAEVKPPRGKQPKPKLPPFNPLGGI